MEPQNQPLPLQGQQVEAVEDTAAISEAVLFAPQAPAPNRLKWIFIGDQGLRTGWSVAVFIALFLLFVRVVGKTLGTLFPFIKKEDFSPGIASMQELIPLLAMLGAGLIVALLERRRILDFNLSGPRRARNFLSGMAAGFLALSALVGGLTWGGWLHFGAMTLTAAEIVRFGTTWGCCFLLVGLVEEGMFRCYLQFTLTRGINFWWALASVACMCTRLATNVKGQGVWGVYVIALLGLGPCLWLHLKKTQGAGFWQAAWVTSTFFGFVHTGNNGENWIGIFAAGAIGFVFCVSIWVTGSAWWAIGCHASWDWAETYFFGTADSGLPAKGHYLTTSPAGNVLWSGGTDGPEGSLLVLGVILFLLVALLLIYGRRRVVATVAVPGLRPVEG